MTIQAFENLLKEYAEETNRLRAQLKTEKELREGAEKNYKDLCTFLRGDVPHPSYNLHVLEMANSLRKRIEEGCS